jgi:large-conductance mechanosensitive channel
VIRLVHFHPVPQFHNIFLEAAGNEQLASTLQQLVNKFQRFTILLALSGKNPELDQIQELVDQYCEEKGAAVPPPPPVPTKDQTLLTEIRDLLKK